MNDFVREMWERIIGKNVEEWVDPFGYSIRFNEYGIRSKHGWTIDHIWPLSPNGQDYKEGSESAQNLQILSTKANNKKANQVTGKINGVIFSVKKVSTDKYGKNIGRMKIIVDKNWKWAY